MSNYSKEEILQIAEYLVEELRELDDGASTTTAKLAADCGYDDMDMSELFELDEACSKLPRKIISNLICHHIRIWKRVCPLTWISS